MKQVDPKNLKRVRKTFNFKIMKTKLIILISLVLGASILFSCKKNNDNNVVTSDSIYTIQRVTNPSLIKRFDNFTRFKSLKSSGISFDFSKVYRISIKNNPKLSFLMVRSVGYNKNNKKNYGLSVGVKNSDSTFHTPFIAETDRVNDTIYKINYFNEKNRLTCSMVINLTQRTVQFTHQKSSMSIMYEDCGDKVEACLEDVYTNHGWASLAVFIETAFIPETSVAFAADCYGHMCM